MKIICRIIIFSVIFSALSFSLIGCTEETKSTDSDVQITNESTYEGKLVVKVVDKSSKKPLNDAKVTIVGINSIYKTDDRGFSPEITLKINKDFYKKYGENLLEKAPAGSATVIVSKDGYKDYVLFNKDIYPGYASNSLNVELPKLSKSDKEKFIAYTDRPHDVWIEELIEYCKNTTGERSGSGENKININVKDNNKKSIEGVSLIIPELGIKDLTDEKGKVTLSPDIENVGLDAYPVKKDYLEYTIVAIKEGYKPEVLLNAAVYSNKDNSIDITLEADKDKDQNAFVVSCQPADNLWVEKLINSQKNIDTE